MFGCVVPFSPCTTPPGPEQCSAETTSAQLRDNTGSHHIHNPSHTLPASHLQYKHTLNTPNIFLFATLQQTGLEYHHAYDMTGLTQLPLQPLPSSVTTRLKQWCDSTFLESIAAVRRGNHGGCKPHIHSRGSEFLEIPIIYLRWPLLSLGLSGAHPA